MASDATVAALGAEVLFQYSSATRSREGSLNEARAALATVIADLIAEAQRDVLFTLAETITDMHNSGGDNTRKATLRDVFSKIVAHRERIGGAS